MRRPRIFLAGGAVPGQEVPVPVQARHHLARVLRLRPGDRLTGVTPDGVELELEWISAEAARVLSAGQSDAEPRAAVTLALCIPRGSRMDWAVEKAVELGAAAIQPLIAERSPVTEAGSERALRWGRLAESAARQSRRLAVPPVLTPLPLAEAVRATEGPCLLTHPEDGVSVAQALAGPAPPERVLVAVGPEGGWTEREVAAAVGAGAHRVRLGPRILRVETAALVVLTLALAALGELA